MMAATSAWMYHHVGPQTEPHWSSVSPEQFLWHLKWLAENGYQGVSAREWLSREAGENGTSVVLTFDDAFQELSVHALPLLKEFGFKATIFAVTSCIGESNRWDAGADVPVRATLSAAEMREWHAQGVEFGSHTHSHPDLRKLSEPEMREELRRSREVLEDVLGAPVATLAYPYGAADQRIRRIAAEYFAAAFTVNRGVNGPRRNRFDLRRTTILPDDNDRDLWFRTRVGWNPRERVPYHLRRLIGRGAASS